MKALVQDRFVSAEGTVRLDEVESSDVTDNQVPVRVRAASAGLYGWDLPASVEWIGPTVAPIRRPKAHIPGLDSAGEVEALGEDVTRFQAADEVFGWSTGAPARYVSVDEEALTTNCGTPGAGMDDYHAGCVERLDRVCWWDG